MDAVPSKKLRRLYRGLVVLSCLLIVGWCAFAAVRYFHLDYHLKCAFNRCETGQVSQPKHGPRLDDRLGLTLNHLYFETYAKPLVGVNQNLSGLTYMPEYDQLVAVVNRPGTLLVLQTDGEVLRRHPLTGVSDTEGVAYLGDGRVVVLQEKKRTIAVLTLPERDGEGIIADKAQMYPLPMAKQRNSGPEGIGYDAQTDTLYVVKEKAPTGLYSIQGIGRGTPIVHRDLSHLLAATGFATDLSSVEFDPVGRRLLLLSDEAQALFTLSLEGELLQSRSLWPSVGGGFALPMPQPEGVAIGANNHVYVVSEPNLFSVLAPEAR
ncbi:MAG: SdiA-regulated domain-containing protein [Neisseriaceae bacterium]|nr:SdiA-regulated domain-containing protein [Neisseriaceae bacterium]